MGEYRTFSDSELTLLLSVYLTPCEVGWQEIRREGYTTRIETEHACKSPYRLGLAKARNSLEECMSTREEGDDQLVDEGILPDDLALDICLDRLERVVDMGESWVHSQLRITNRSITNTRRI